MPNAFEIKRVLDRMNKLGHQHKNIKTVAEAAAKELCLSLNSPAVVFAILYSQYELLCMSQNKKPMSLGTWIAKPVRRQQHAS